MIKKICFKKRRWLVFTVLGALSWAIWGTLTKFVSGEVSPYTYQLLFTIGMLFSLPLVVKRCKRNSVNIRGIIWGIGTSTFAVAGNILVYQSFNAGGQASVVIPFTNLYPLITIVLAFIIFKEKLNILNGVGILVVVPAIIILSGQSEVLLNPALFFQQNQFDVWLIFATFSLFLFALFNISQKITAGFISAEWSYVSFMASSVLISLGFIVAGLVEFQFSTQTFWIGSLAGMFDGLGVLAIYAAYRAAGKASQVSPIVATLQQLFTIGLAIIFLSEKLSVGELTGIGLAIVGSWFLLYEKHKVSKNF